MSTGKKILPVIQNEWNFYFAANYVEADFEVATFLALIGGRCIWRAEEFGR